MNQVIDIMLSAVRTQVCGAARISYEKLSPEDMGRLYSVAKSQDMAHIVASELEKQKLLKNDDKISNKFRKQFMISVFRYERINYEFK